jgi:hypothetical protein
MAGWLSGQPSARETTTYIYDGMGNRTPATSSTSSRTGSGSQNVERVRSVNGREVPVESVQERVVSVGGGVRVVERMVRRYDAEGQPGPPEKTRVEERTAADGSVTTATSRYRGDLNGSYQLAEKTVEQSRKTGNVTTLTTSVERPSLNATLDLVEKSTRTTSEKENATHSESVTYRRDAGGSFYAAAQEVADRTKTPASVAETVTTFEGAPGGKMRFSRRTVSTARTAADGSEHRETDVYNVVVPGQVSSAEEARPQLRERQILERKTDASGAVVETVSVRRPSLADPQRLGGEQKISEVVCRGCDAPKKP